MSARRAAVASVVALTGLVTACSGTQAQNAVPPQATSAATTTTVPGQLRVEVVAEGLEHGWDIGFLPGGRILVSQRPGKLALISGPAPGATVTPVRADFSDVLVRGEGGLLGMVLHPDFAQNRRFITCQTHKADDEAVDVRLVTWELAPDGASATRVGPLLTGLPVNSSGRHSGCRPTIGADGALYVGTGDTASNPDIPQDMTSLGGKVLRIDIDTGAGLPDNPFASADNPNTRRIFTYGHRNVQGVAIRPSTGTVFTAEHGPTHYDEVSELVPGGNYGWDPSKGGSTDDYEEDVPMTDLERFPDAIPQIWTSGDVTQAPCGAAFIDGEQWGPLDGTLAVVALRGQKLLLFALDESGAVTDVTLPPKFDDTFGRLRAIRSGPDGAMYVTTSNGDNDKLLRITPP